jgi:hypothetical protein
LCYYLRDETGMIATTVRETLRDLDSRLTELRGYL